MLASTLKTVVRTLRTSRALVPAAHVSTSVKRHDSHSGMTSDAERRESSPSTTTARNEGRVSFEAGRVRVGQASFSPIHLRDHCRCTECCHPVTKQRLLDTVKLPQDLAPTSLRSTDAGVEVVWSDGGHRSFYAHQLLDAIAPGRTTTLINSIPSMKNLWDASTELSPRSRPTITAQALTASPSGVRKALELIQLHGVLFIEGVEPSPTDTERVSRLLGGGKLRNTHYDDFWDFTADMKHGDLAYSDQALRAHTDTSYFSDPCGLQIFHLLSHPPPGTGGHTLLVDAFACAAQLLASNPEAYSTLSSLKTSAHASGSDGFLFSTEKDGGFEVFRHGSGGELRSVRWNPEDRGALGGDSWSEADVQKWYEAARAWEAILRMPENEKWVKLEPGTVVVIDNHRVMHGRSAFTGERRMCGAYISRDEWMSTLEVLRSKQHG